MPGLLRGIARTAAIAGTASAVGGRVHHRQNQRWARQEEEQYAQQAPPQAAPAAAAGPSTLDQLKQLGELKDQGVLTEAEFVAQKAKLLAA
ncbi:MAG: SHOCT domain-containing protein [Actinobacteria bacterium]|nr:SHOCT domain-containing protein [Actinomycetota bacterium]